MYIHASGERNTTLYMLKGKHVTIFDNKKNLFLKEYVLILRIGRILWEEAIKDDTYEHGLIGKVFNRDNQFRNIVETNINS